MASYLVDSGEVTRTVQVRKAPIVLMVQFDLPEEVRDTLPQSEVIAITGKRDMSFYLEPQEGDFIAWSGHIWACSRRVIYPYPYAKAGTRRTIPLVLTEYICADTEKD